MQPDRLYALVDGLLYTRAARPESLVRTAHAIALFDGTQDASLADAGPWLIDCDEAMPSWRKRLNELAAGPVGVSWLISNDTPELLARALRERLDIRMPDGRLAWLRFHDAQIMSDIVTVLSPSQRMQFFAPVVEWLVEINGALTRIFH
jgi:hypothetical protein